MSIQESDSFSHIFSFSSSFLPQLVKKCPTKWVKNFSTQIFMKIAVWPNFDMENSKIEFIPDFFIFIFIFAFCFSPTSSGKFVLSVLLASAVGLNRNYPSVLFATLLRIKHPVLGNPFLWCKLLSTLKLVVKFPESSVVSKVI